MAVRRVSDLPELKSYYPDAQLSDCLLEVSYNLHENVYQSFYSKADELFAGSVNVTRDMLPIATKADLGAVIIGNNIEVNDQGIISVAMATNNKAGVVKLPSANADYLGIVNNQLIPVDAPTVTHVDAGEYQIVNYSYPIGSLWMTDSFNARPPGVASTAQIDNDGNVQGVAPESGSNHIRWHRLDGGYSLWATSIESEAGATLSAILPDVATKIQCSSAGKHAHQQYIGYSSRGSGSSAYLQVNRVEIPSKQYSPGKTTMSTVDAHTHTISFKKDAQSVYTGTDDTVRPTSLGIVIWKRLNDG